MTGRGREGFLPVVRPGGQREGRPLGCPRLPCRLRIATVGVGVAIDPAAVDSAELSRAEPNRAIRERHTAAVRRSVWGKGTSPSD